MPGIKEFENRGAVLSLYAHAIANALIHPGRTLGGDYPFALDTTKQAFSSHGPRCDEDACIR